MVALLGAPGLLILGASTKDHAKDLKPPSLPVPQAVARVEAPAPAKPAIPDVAAKDSLIRDEKERRRSGPPKAIAGYEGIPTPGNLITLKSDRSVDAVFVRWVQTQGPPTPLEEPTSPSPKVRVPEGAGVLGFDLIASNAEGIDTAPVAIRVTGRDGTTGELRIVANAGDDQVGIVGRQITLNGGRSEPKGLVGYRWLQVGGPRVRLELDDGYIYSFVPQAPGVYQFALIVARGSEMSRPDLVNVSVGSPSSPYGIDPTPDAPEALHAVARAALAEVPGGIAVGPDLAEIFDGIADRMDLYRCYSETYSELSRRLESVLPADPVRRAVWDDRLFNPLTVRLIEGMRSEGLDLRRTESQSVALTSSQRARLADLFRGMSQGFRATRPAP